VEFAAQNSESAVNIQADARFSLGIDLGTTNSAVALEDLETGWTGMVEMTQLLGPNRIGEKPTLPSAVYIPHPDEFPKEQLRLPWEEKSSGVIVGHFARDHGALIPDRLITSAKSWLSNFHVDPRKPVLPWKSDINEPKLSALDCSRLYLEHMKLGFLNAERARDRSWNIDEGQVVITVPASFDEVARNLTLEAALAAGFSKLVLLEEPQAAFYAWMEQSGSDWRKQVGPGDIVLVCDVGGGTSDFSLIAIAEKDGNLEVERISVGEHILLGGDNMDLALAYTLRSQLEAAGKTIDEWQFLSLIHTASNAKVRLFTDSSLPETQIAVPSRGSSLLAKTVSVKLDRATLEQVVLDGFFPLTKPSELPQEAVAAGLRELGLPYAADPVISKHLARFLRRSLINVKGSETLVSLNRRHSEANTSRPLPCFLMGAYSTRRQFESASSTFWLRGMMASPFVSWRDSNQTSRLLKELPCTVATAPPVKGFGSRRGRRGLTILVWSRRCPRSQDSSRQLKPCVSCPREWKKGANC
jgi:molecular chaperone DnaK (HSP70)